MFLIPKTIRGSTKIAKEDAARLVMRITDGDPPPSLPPSPLRKGSADFSEGKQQPLPLQTDNPRRLQQRRGCVIRNYV